MLTPKSRKAAKKRWRSIWRRPKHRWQAGLIMAAMTIVMGVLVGMSGYRKYAALRKPVEPRSFQGSLALGVVVGAIVFLLYTFDKWPYPDLWPREQKRRD